MVDLALLLTLIVLVGSILTLFAAMDRAAELRIQRAAIRAVVGVSTCPHRPSTPSS